MEYDLTRGTMCMEYDLTRGTMYMEYAPARETDVHGVRPSARNG